MLNNASAGVAYSYFDDGPRSGTDRRESPTPIMSRYTFLGGRRKVVRRENDKKGHIYVDLYSARLMAAVVSLLFLSCIDAFMTLELIGQGKVVEANPVMAYVMSFGTMSFTLVKFGITAFSLTVLCLFKNVKITRVCLPIAIKMYVLVVIYEFYLLYI